MPRRPNTELTREWKLHISATLAGAVEFELLDPITERARYGSRSVLVQALLINWLAERHGRKARPLNELISHIESTTTYQNTTIP